MIKLYFDKITEYSQADYTKMYSLLECAIRQKIDAKKQNADKQRSLIGYTLLYRGFSELYNKTDVKITFNQHGKPLCDFCFFSISHSDECVVCALSDMPIGIDIQKIPDVIEREKYKFFNPKENFYVNQNGKFTSEKYIEIFTKKEAAVKMLGLSLSQSWEIDTFSSEYRFKTDFRDDYVITICTENV